jgi:hypothetical protein
VFGFDAISASNGWSMALVGILIVFSGLVILSFAISQIHKLLNILEKRESAPEPIPVETGSSQEGFPDRCPSDIREVARYFQPLIDQLPSPFALADLYDAATKKKFPHPHLTIRCLREAGILVPLGEGQFTWNG